MKAANPDTDRKIVAIREIVARMFNLRIEELCMDSKKRAITIPRQIAMYLAKHETAASLVEIGRHFGDMHQATVMHAIARVAKLRRTDSATNLAIEALLTRLNTTPVASEHPND